MSNNPLTFLYLIYGKGQGYAEGVLAFTQNPESALKRLQAGNLTKVQAELASKYRTPLLFVVLDASSKLNIVYKKQAWTTTLESLGVRINQRLCTRTNLFPLMTRALLEESSYPIPDLKVENVEDAYLDIAIESLKVMKRLGF